MSTPVKSTTLEERARKRDWMHLNSKGQHYGRRSRTRRTSYSISALRKVGLGKAPHEAVGDGISSRNVAGAVEWKWSTADRSTPMRSLSLSPTFRCSAFLKNRSISSCLLCSSRPVREHRTGDEGFDKPHQTSSDEISSFSRIFATIRQHDAYERSRARSDSFGGDDGNES